MSRLTRAELEVVLRDQHNNIGYGNEPALIEDVQRNLKEEWGWPTDDMVNVAKRQMLHYFDEELFLGLEQSLAGIVDWDWLALAVLESALGLRRGQRIPPEILDDVRPWHEAIKRRMAVDENKDDSDE